METLIKKITLAWRRFWKEIEKQNRIQQRFYKKHPEARKMDELRRYFEWRKF